MRVAAIRRSDVGREEPPNKSLEKPLTLALG